MLHSTYHLVHVITVKFIDIFVNCNWVNTRWQCYSTHNQYIEQHHNNRTTQITAQQNNNRKTIAQHNDNYFWRVRTVPRLVSLTLAFALQLRKKRGNEPSSFIKYRKYFVYGVINFSRRVLLHRVGWSSVVFCHVSLSKLRMQSLWDHIVASYISLPPTTLGSLYKSRSSFLCNMLSWSSV